MYSVSQSKYNALKKENERLKALLSEDLAAENAKLKMRIAELEEYIDDMHNEAREEYPDD